MENDDQQPIQHTCCSSVNDMLHSVVAAAVMLSMVRLQDGAVGKRKSMV